MMQQTLEIYGEAQACWLEKCLIRDFEASLQLQGWWVKSGWWIIVILRDSVKHNAAKVLLIYVYVDTV